MQDRTEAVVFSREPFNYWVACTEVREFRRGLRKGSLDRPEHFSRVSFPLDDDFEPGRRDRSHNARSISGRITIKPDRPQQPFAVPTIKQVVTRTPKARERLRKIKRPFQTQLELAEFRHTTL